MPSSSERASDRRHVDMTMTSARSVSHWQSLRVSSASSHAARPSQIHCGAFWLSLLETRWARWMGKPTKIPPQARRYLTASGNWHHPRFITDDGFLLYLEPSNPSPAHPLAL